jgi:hypothetical protein
MEDFWGPYIDRSLAERVQKIAYMAGLLPWRIVAEIEGGELQKTTCSLTWPPEAQEGIIRGEADNSGEFETVEYMIWAKTETDAKRRLAQLSAAPKAKAEAA